MREKIVGLFVCMLLIATGITVVADWEEGDSYKMHFPQLPDPYGWDVDFGDWYLGDDWKCSETGFITEVHFWYSWAQDNVVDIPWIYMSIWSNDPSSPSKPKQMLWERQFYPSQFVIAGPWEGDQGWYNPFDPPQEHDHNFYWQINIRDIADPYEQHEGIIYWLVIKMPQFVPDAFIGWKTSKDHWNDNAVHGFPDNWFPLWDPIIEPPEPIDFAFVVNEVLPRPKLSCEGELFWMRVRPKGRVIESFAIGNIGGFDSMLRWEVSGWPSWGSNWEFSPSNGTLPAGGWTNVSVSVEAPDQKNQNFTGKITVINLDDTTDFCEIDVSLTTPRIKGLNFNFDILDWLLERFPHAFPILRQILGL